jgi:hypothetical protein
MQQTVYNINSVKPRDLSEDWGINNVDEIEALIATMKPFTRADIKEHTVEELEAVARSLM